MSGKRAKTSLRFWAAACLAVVLPVAVWVPSTTWMYGQVDFDTHALRLEAELAASEAEVLVLGSSLANRGIDEDVLADALGLREEQVLVLQLPHASVAHHYAVLKNRVFAEGHRPRVVVVAAAMNAMLHHELLTFQPNLDRLVDQMGPDEPVLGARVFGLSSPTQLQWMVARERAGAWRASILEGLADAFVGWSTDRNAYEVEQLTTKINEQVFDDAAMDYDLHEEVATGVGRKGARMRAIDLPPFELRTHGLLDVMQALATAHEASLVWVRMPLPPSSQALDVVSPELEDAALSWWEELGSGFLDMRTLPLGELDFEDSRHLSPEGAQVLSQSLGEALRTMRVLSPAPQVSVVRGAPTPDTTVRTGEATWPVSMGDAPDLDDTWLLPGQSLEMQWASGWGLPARSFGVAFSARAHAEGATPSVLLAGDPVEISRDGHALSGELMPASAPSGPWTLAVHNPLDGAPLKIQYIGIGVAPATTTVMGASPSARASSLRLLGGRREDTRAKVTVTGDLPAALTPAVRPGPRGLGLFVMPKFAELADGPDTDVARPSRCSPLRILEDGVPLERHHAPCYDVQEQRGGRSCHAGPSVYFSASDNSSPQRNGRAYAVHLSPDRHCDTYAQYQAAMIRDVPWLYPGDVLRVTAPPGRLAALSDGVDRVDLEVSPMVVDPSADLQITLLVDGESWEETTWRPTERRRTLHSWALERPVPAGAQDVSVQVANVDAATFYLVTALTLAEGEQGRRVEETKDTQTRGTLRAAVDEERVLAGIRRVGEVPALPPLKAPEGAGGGVQEARLFAAWPFSDTVLAKHDLPGVSPLELVEGETVYRREVDRKAFRTRCTACFLHMGHTVAYRAYERVDAIPETRLTAAFPMQTANGPQAWVYPSTTIEADLPEGVSGELTVRLYAASVRRGWRGEGLVVSVGDREAQPLASGRDMYEATLQLSGSGPQTLQIHSATPEAYALVLDLQVTDANDTTIRLTLPEP